MLIHTSTVHSFQSKKDCRRVPGCLLFMTR